tara:strand:- start:3142 stop:4017 length:876 start_codon:yes stop_codon:yes gene_type:complete
MRKRPTLSAEQNTNTHNQYSRRSFMHISALTSLAASNSMLAGFVKRVEPVEQPDRYEPIDPYVYNYPRELPSPDAPVETIMRNLLTPQDYASFIDKYTTFETPSFPIEFFNTYRRSPQEFQNAGWQGCCNDYTEFACNWAYRHRHTPYVVSICPEGIIEPIKDGWHQFAVLRTDEDSLLIFDNKTVAQWNGTVDEYIEEKHSSSTMLPFGGCAKWKRTQDNWTARMAYQSVPNENDLAISTMPQIPEQPVRDLASEEKLSTPMLAMEQMAALRQQRDDLMRLLPKKMLTSK